MNLKNWSSANPIKLNPVWFRHSFSASRIRSGESSSSSISIITRRDITRAGPMHNGETFFNREKPSTLRNWLPGAS